MRPAILPLFLAIFALSCAAPPVRGPSLPRLIRNQEATYRLDRLPGGNGTAIVLSHDGYLLTARHVACHDKPDLRVIVTEGESMAVTYHARVVVCDEENDLAVVKIDRTFEHAVVLGDLEDFYDGDPIYHIGYPYTLGQVVGRGYIMNRDFSDKDLKVRHVLLLDAPDGRGTSGAGIFNGRDGKVIGLMMMMVGIGPQNQPIEMWVRIAVRVDAIRRLLDQARIPYLTEPELSAGTGPASFEAAPTPVSIVIVPGH